MRRWHARQPRVREARPWALGDNPFGVPDGVTRRGLRDPGLWEATPSGYRPRHPPGPHGHPHRDAPRRLRARHPRSPFFAVSRHRATPRHLLFALNADAADYTVLPDSADEDGLRHWDVLRMVLEDAPQKLTRQDILDEWPEDFARPSAATLWKWLRRAVDSRLILHEGTGRKADPFRYWLADSEARWRQTPLYDVFEAQARELNLPFESLGQRKRKERAETNAGVDEPAAGGVWPP